MSGFAFASASLVPRSVVGSLSLPDSGIDGMVFV